MGTISEKLVHLNGTKQAIKQAINEDFEVIDNNTTFREYAEEISSNNAKYKDLIPKETKNATNTLDISNSSGLDKALVTQYGNTYQETTTGKNLLYLLNGTKTNNGITGVWNNGILIYSGEATNTYAGITGITNTSLPAGTYTFSIDHAVDIQVRFRYLEVTNKDVIIQPGNTSATFTLTESTKRMYVFLNVLTVDSNYSDTLKIQLEKGTTATDWEKYSGGNPAPNPDYPQEIQVVTGDNSINVCGKNLLDLPNVSTTSNGVTSTITNGKLKIVGTTTTNWFSICNLNIPLESGTYIFSYTNKKINRYNFRIKYEDNTIQVIYGNTYSNTPITLNKNATITSMFSDNNTTGATFDYEDYLMLEKGSTATEYEQYQSQTYEVDLPVENLFDKDNANVLNGNLVSSSSITSSASNRIFYINCQPNTTYTVQKAVGNYFVLGTTSSTPTIGGSYSQKTMDNTATKISITTDANAKYLICWYWNNGDTLTEEQTKATIQVELGTKANKYQPYGTTPIELCKIVNYKDRIYPLNGKWYLEKKIGKVVLNGSESWSASRTTTPYVYGLSIITDYLKTNENICKSNYFESTINGGYGVMTDNQIKFRYASDSNYALYICTTIASTSANFKTWLSTHNTTVYYVLATPTTTEITENNYPTLYNQLNNIKLFEGVNHITMTNESGLDVEFDITYYKDWKLD